MKHLFIGILISLTQLTLGQNLTLDIHITGVGGTGRVHVQLFEKGQKFKPDSGECLEQVLSCQGSCQLQFTGLKKGTYAAMIYHDENNNGFLDTNVLGMPREGVGASNNVKGIPSFKKCRFELSESGEIHIEMVYL